MAFSWFISLESPQIIDFDAFSGRFFVCSVRIAVVDRMPHTFAGRICSLLPAVACVSAFNFAPRRRGGSRRRGGCWAVICRFWDLRGPIFPLLAAFWPGLPPKIKGHYLRGGLWPKSAIFGWLLLMKSGVVLKCALRICILNLHPVRDFSLQQPDSAPGGL